MGCGASSLKGSAGVDESALASQPIVLPHSSVSKTTAELPSYDTTARNQSSSTASKPDHHHLSTASSSTSPETAQPRRRSRFSRSRTPTDEEMLRYTGKTNAEMKAWAAETRAAPGYDPSNGARPSTQPYNYGRQGTKANPWGGPQDGMVAGQLMGMDVGMGMVGTGVM